MALRTINCPKCLHLLPEQLLNQHELQPCPNCRTPFQIEVFPALFRPAETGRTGEIVLSDTEASCFYHAQKRAVVPCAACGRFLCALCDCELNGQHYCPGCLDAGKTRGKIKSLETGRTRYDNIALAVAVLPVLIPFFTIISAPIALFMVLRHWNSPRGLTQSSRAALMAAGVIALLEIAVWVMFFIMIFKNNG